MAVARPAGICIEFIGEDGSGKTTQAVRLVSWIRSMGLEATLYRSSNTVWNLLNDLYQANARAQSITGFSERQPAD